MFKKILVLAFLTIVLSLAAALELNNAAIVIAPDAQPSEKLAAQTLAEYLNKITGKEFQVTVASVPGKPAIMIGSQAAEKAGLTLARLGNEGLLIKTHAGNLHLTGGTPAGRGTIYAVYEFLERLGCRFWSLKEEHIPSQPSLQIEDTDIRMIPAFPEFRYIVSTPCVRGERLLDGKLKFTGYSFAPPVDPKYGIMPHLAPWNSHTYRFFLPAEKYGRTNPEFFALRNGKRFCDDRNSQLCLTNPEMRTEFIKNCQEYLRLNYTPAMLLVISPSDNSSNCQCENCARSDAEEGSPSGTLLRFVNAVAAELQKDYPDIRIETTAYLHTRKPPEITAPAPNVSVRLANIEGDFSRAHDTPAENRKFFQELKDWTKLTQNIHLTEYGANFDAYLLPLPNFDALAQRFRDFRANGVNGIYTINAHGRAFGEFLYLRDYLTAKLMWNPELDPWEITADFCHGYYGPAGKHLLEYLRFYHGYFRQRQTSFRYFSFSPDYNLACRNPEFLKTADEYFKKAFEAVGNDRTLARRVAEACLSVRYMKLQEARFRIATDPTLLRELDAFAADYRAVGGNLLGEGQLSALDIFVTGCKIPIPADIKGIVGQLTPENVRVIAPRLYGKDKIKMIDDPHAATGKAWQIATDHTIWCLQAKTETLMDIADFVRWDIYIRARVIPGLKANRKTVAFEAGVLLKPKQATRREFLLAETSAEEYRYFKIGTGVIPSLQTYAWVAPVNNPEEVASLIADLFIFVKTQ